MSCGDIALHKAAERHGRSAAVRQRLVALLGRNAGPLADFSRAGVVQPERMLLALTARAWVACARGMGPLVDDAAWIESDLGWSVSLEPIRCRWQASRTVAEEVSARVASLPVQQVRCEVLGALHHDLYSAARRHALGEHYTPDWLCERILSEMGAAQGGALLDPACGSGAFLVAALRMRMEAEPDRDVAALAAELIGLDRSDISVDLARAGLWSVLAARCGAGGPLPELRLSVGEGLDGPPGGERVKWVVGNPPWLTLADVQPESGQSALRERFDALGLLPVRRRDRPHLDLATVFFGQARSWLETKGQVAMVLPRSVMTASQHQPLRSSGRISALWDLERVRPLFPVPACVAFGTTESVSPPFAGESLSGAPGGITGQTCLWHLARMGGETAFSEVPLTIVGGSLYRDRFRQGASLVPGVCWFVEPGTEGWTSATWARDVAKPPWRMQGIAGPLEDRFVYFTARGRNIVPFGAFGLVRAFVPFDRGVVFDSKALHKAGARHAAAWMARAEHMWTAHRTPRSRDMTLVDRLDYQRGLSVQHPPRRWSVLFAASAKDANAVCLDTADLSAPFVADTTTYRFQTDSEREAHFLTAVINADLANRRIKVFQARGLFGPRHVHKRILDAVPVGKFDLDNGAHRALSDLGKACAEQVCGRLQDHEDGLSPRALGILRVEIRAELAPLLKEIDLALQDALG